MDATTPRRSNAGSPAPQSNAAAAAAAAAASAAAAAASAAAAAASGTASPASSLAASLLGGSSVLAVASPGMYIENLFVYNAIFGPTEETEHEKIVFYHPSDVPLDTKIKQVGLCEALVKFAATFSVDRPCESMHSMRSRQVFFEPEPEYWMVMTVTVPVTLKTGKDGRQVEEFAEEDVQDNILLTALHQSYAMFKLFNGRFTDIYSQFSLKILRHKLQEFFPRYLTSLRTEHFDLLTACNGIQFMPLDKNTYLRVQCFVNLTETTFPQIKHTVFLHNEHLIWSGLEQDDMRTLYRLLTSGFLSATLTGSSEPGSRTTKGGKASATGGSGSGTNISLFQQQQQAALREMQPFLLSNRVGYITGPEDLSDPDTPVNAPQLFVESAQDGESLHLIIYQSNNAIVCFLVDASVHFDIKFYRDLDSYIAPQVRGLSETISEHLAKRSAVESHYRYIYYNHMNLALKSTMHNKRQLTVPPDVLRILSDMRSHFEKSPLTHELVVKMLSDCWVVGRKSEQREIFVMLQQKNANLIEINDEVRRLCMTLFNNIFLE